jgi:hypothetical protein
MNAATKIQQLPLPESDREALLSIAPEFDRLKSYAPDRIARIRAKLNDLKHSGPKSAHHVVCAALCLLKTVTDHLPTSNQLSHHDHIVTDHALCCAMTRYLGVDLNRLKDDVLAVSRDKSWPHVKKNGRIITFYPEEARQVT